MFPGDSLGDIKLERERSDTPDSIAGYELMTLGMYPFFSSPEQKLRVSYCHHPLSVVRRRQASVGRRQQLVC